MKPYVGIANRIPASRTPRRFTIAISAIAASDSATRYGASDPTAEVIAKTPLATETATVRM